MEEINMSYQEKKSLTNIISSVVITIIYAIIMYQRYSNGAFDTTNVMKLWAIIILIFIPISIVAKIIIEIMFRITDNVVSTVKGEEVDEGDIVDERDRLIGLKATQISMAVFVIGFMLALISQVMNMSNHTFFIILVVFGLLSELASETMTILYYRKGV